MTHHTCQPLCQDPDNRKTIRDGSLTDQTRLEGGDLLGRLVVLRSRVGEREFVNTVRAGSAAVQRVMGRL